MRLHRNDADMALVPPTPHGRIDCAACPAADLHDQVSPVSP